MKLLKYSYLQIHFGPMGHAFENLALKIFGAVETHTGANSPSN